MKNALVKYAPGRSGLVASVAAGLFGGFASVAGATAPYDLSSATTGVTDQIQAAVTTGLPIMAGILALLVGIRVIRRLVKG